MERQDILRNSRLAGAVTRYHAWSTLQKQTVADHSYHCIRIWWEIFGPLSPHITTYFLWHDAGELVAGDLPFPIKSQNGVLKLEMDKLEANAVRDMGGVVFDLDATEKTRAKAVDLCEMYEFGKMELLLGNRLGQPIVDDTFKALEKLPFVGEDGTAVFKYLARWERLKA